MHHDEKTIIGMMMKSTPRREEYNFLPRCKGLRNHRTHDVFSAVDHQRHGAAGMMLLVMVPCRMISGRRSDSYPEPDFQHRHAVIISSAVRVA